MITVKIELWPFGDESRAKEIGRMYVANDGAGDRERGDYKVAVCRRGTTEVPKEIYLPEAPELAEEQPKAARAGEVKEYPRLAYNVWRLIARSIVSAFPEEQRAHLKIRAHFDTLVARGFELLAMPLREALKSTAKLPENDDGAAIQAALDWLDGAARDDV